MKKSLFSITLGALTILAVSCSKTYTCNCETDDGHKTNSQISEGSREKSEKSCKDMEYTHTSELNGQTYTSTNRCELQ